MPLEGWIWLMGVVEYKDMDILTRCRTHWRAIFPLELSIVWGEVLLDLYHNWINLFGTDPTNLSTDIDLNKNLISQTPFQSVFRLPNSLYRTIYYYFSPKLNRFKNSLLHLSLMEAFSVLPNCQVRILTRFWMWYLSWFNR